MMCVSKYPSVSSIQPVLHKLLHTLEVKQSDSRVICAIKKAINDDLVNHYSSHDLKAFLDIATYLHLRYKELPYYHDADSYKKVEEELYQKLDSLPAEMLPNHQALVIVTLILLHHPKRKRVQWKIFLEIYSVKYLPAVTILVLPHAMNWHSTDQKFQLSLEWWEKRQHVYPRLSQLVMWCFSFVGTSVPSETIQHSW